MNQIEFGTGGFRGIIGKTFTKENIELVGQAIANLINQKQWHKDPVIIGFDNRMDSDNAAIWISNVLNGNGIHTLLFTHSVPTPMVMLGTKERKHKIGIMITASHNPYYYNGVKVFKEGGFDADIELTSEIENCLPKHKRDVNSMDYFEARQKKFCLDFNNDIQYCAFISKFLLKKPFNNKINVLFDDMHGTANVALCKIKKLLPINKFCALHTNRDVIFENKIPNPTKNELGVSFFERVKGKFDVGIATDSDGDRLGVCDEQGHYVNANEILASIYYYLIKYRNMQGDIVRNIATSSLIDKVANKLSFKCHECDVGFKNVTTAMKQYDALLGGESSGGLTMRGFINGKDSTFSSALFIEMISQMGKTTSQIIKEIKDFAGYDSCFLEDCITLTEDKLKVFDYIDKNQPKFNTIPTSFIKLGMNYKWYFGEDWILIRLSGTEPSFRIFAECKTENKTHEYVNQLKKYINEIQNDIRKNYKK